MLLNQPDPWGAHASMYDKGFAPITSMYAFDMLQFAQLPSGSTCVDVGCGPGVAAAIAAQRGVHVIATDFSQGMVDMATAKLKALGLPFEAKVCDGQTLEPIGDSAVDAVISTFAQFVFPDRPKGWAAALRVLKPGGTLATTSWDHSFPVGRALRQVMVMMAAELPGFVVPEQFPTGVPALFKAEVEAAGFQDVTVRSVSHDVVFESGKDMIDAFADHPFMKAVPAAMVPRAKRVIYETVTGTSIADEDGAIETLPQLREPVHVRNCIGHICIGTKPTAGG